MVAPVPSPFVLDPSQTEAFLEDISSFDMCLRDVAKKYNTTVGGLALYITSEDGLQTIATSELAAALRIRLTALHLLPDVVQAMGYIVNEYSREERRIPMENSLRRIRLLELKRRNAHRAGTLIFKLAHFNPRPIKSYTVRPAAQSDRAAHSVQPSASSNGSDFLAAESAQTCGMPKRPLGHGSAFDPEVADGTAIEVDGFASTSMNTCAVQDDPAAQCVQPCASSNESDVVAAESTQTCGMPKRPLGHGSAFESSVADCTAIEAVGSASTSTRFTSLHDDEASVSPSAVSSSPISPPCSCTCSPKGCSKRAAGEAALRGAHPRTATPNQRTLKGSSTHNADPPSPGP